MGATLLHGGHHLAKNSAQMTWQRQQRHGVSEVSAAQVGIMGWLGADLLLVGGLLEQGVPLGHRGDGRDAAAGLRERLLVLVEPVREERRERGPACRGAVSQPPPSAVPVAAEASTRGRGAGGRAALGAPVGDEEHQEDVEGVLLEVGDDARRVDHRGQQRGSWQARLAGLRPRLSTLALALLWPGGCQQPMANQGGWSDLGRSNYGFTTNYGFIIYTQVRMTITTRRRHDESFITNYGFIIYTQVRMTKLLVVLSVAVISSSLPVRYAEVGR